jgi:hypothetical protein
VKRLSQNRNFLELDVCGTTRRYQLIERSTWFDVTAATAP